MSLFSSKVYQTIQILPPSVQIIFLKGAIISFSSDHNILSFISFSSISFFIQSNEIFCLFYPAHSTITHLVLFTHIFTTLKYYNFTALSALITPVVRRMKNILSFYTYVPLKEETPGIRGCQDPSQSRNLVTDFVTIKLGLPCLTQGQVCGRESC